MLIIESIASILLIFGFLQPLWADNSEIHALFEQELKVEPDTIESLHFGLTNRNFRVAANGHEYFIRIGTDFPALLCIERDVEEKFYKMAQELDLVPVLIYCDTNRGIMITPYVQGTRYGKIMGKWTGNPKEVIACIVQHMKRIHSMKAPISHSTPYPLRVLEHYYQAGKKMGVQFPEKLSQAVDLAMTLNISFGERVLCHHDFFWTNLLHDGKKLWIVDWEYADWDDPMYDLAGFCIKQNLNEAEREIALREYLPCFQNEDHYKFDKMCMLYALNSSIWGFIQNKIQPDAKIDIESIAQKHLGTFWQLANKIEADTRY